MAFANDRMNPFRPVIHEIDTRPSNDLAVFDGSHDDEAKLAKQFWTSVLLTPPVESTLVCKEIKQRVKSRTLASGTNQPRFSTSPVKKPKEKTVRDKEYDEATFYQKMKDEAQRIEMNYQRQRQVRRLFHQQSQINRLKHEQWALPPSRHYRNAPESYPLEEQELDEDDDRQAVRSLPD